MELVKFDEATGLFYPIVPNPLTYDGRRALKEASKLNKWLVEHQMTFQMSDSKRDLA